MNQYLSLLYERKLEEAEQYRKQSIPQKLIKFFPLSDRTESNEKKFKTLETENLWISSIDSLNDPYEFSCMYVDKDRLKEAGHPDELIKGFEIIVGDMLRNFGVASLSGNSFDCLPMWAYYANNHAGYCVEYEVMQKDAIHKVFYEQDRIAVASIPANFFNEFQKMREAGENTNPEVEFYANILMQQLFIKHRSWSHENEYRIIFPIGAKKGMNTPLSAVGLKTSKIVAGINCTEEHILKLQEISDKLGCGKVERAQISTVAYKLL